MGVKVPFRNFLNESMVVVSLCKPSSLHSKLILNIHLDLSGDNVFITCPLNVDLRMDTTKTSCVLKRLDYVLKVC
jgi:hypothetical protein